MAGGEGVVLGGQEEDKFYAARPQLGEAAFDIAWAEGRAMTIEQVIEYALGDTAV